MRKNKSSGFALVEIVLLVSLIPVMIYVSLQLISASRGTVRLTKSLATKQRMYVIRSILASSAKDVDSDGKYELWKEKPGNLLPDQITVRTTDEWGTEFRYCTWDPGDQNTVNSTYSDNNWTPPVEDMIGRIISAGRDKIFQTGCNDTSPSGDDIALNIIEQDVRYGNYGSGGGGGSSLWTESDDSLGIQPADSSKFVRIGGYESAEAYPRLEVVGGSFLVRGTLGEDPGEVTGRHYALDNSSMLFFDIEKASLYVGKPGGSGWYAGSYSFVAGDGHEVYYNCPRVAIVGGYQNSIYSDSKSSAVIAGGSNKLWSAYDTVIVGGSSNKVDHADKCAILGGYVNSIGYSGASHNVFESVIVGGTQNSITELSGYDTSSYSTIVGGCGNSIAGGKYCTITSGRNSEIEGGEYISIISGNNVKVNKNSSSGIVAGKNLEISEGSENFAVFGFFSSSYTTPTLSNEFDILGLRVGIGKTGPSCELDVSGSGYFSGNLTVSGNLNVSGTKNFIINDPRPGRKGKLVHAALEGPEAGVYYRGVGRLRKGRAVVKLPDYFRFLVREETATVLLTPKFEGDEVVCPIAASGVKNGRFEVRAYGVDDISGCNHEFYWEVKAERRDVPPLKVEVGE